MNTKDYLGQAYRLDQRINSKLQQISSLRSLTQRVTASFDGEVVSHTRNVTSLEDAIIRLMEEAGRETDQPVEMLVTGGGSDGNFIAVYDCPTVDGCGPCGTLLHTDGEYLIVESVEKRLDIMRATLKKIFA